MLISHASKIMLKILQVRLQLQQYNMAVVSYYPVPGWLNHHQLGKSAKLRAIRLSRDGAQKSVF